MKTKIKGTSTTPAPGVSIVPPNVGTDVSLVLELGDEAYCVGLGPGQGGGTIVANDDRRFTVVNPTGEGTCLP